MQTGRENESDQTPFDSGKTAAFQRRSDTEDGRVVCLLCPHACRLRENEAGRCRVRQHRGGLLRALTYGRVAAISLDPVEKKPLNRFMPGTRTYSIGYNGCNLRCIYCQNADLSMADLADNSKTAAVRMSDARFMTPAECVSGALRSGAPSISYTYNEPLVAYESVLETATLAKAAGLRNILVTNGYICREPMKQLLPFVDAMNIDLKSFDDDLYRKWCGGRLQPVKDTIRLCAASCHVEVTMLVVTGMNDSLEVLRPAFEWLGALDPDIPLHITRYHPANHWNAPPPPASLLYSMQESARKHLEHVYVGNVW